MTAKKKPQDNTKLALAELEKFINDTPHGTWEAGINKLLGRGQLQASRAVDEAINEALSREMARTKIRWQRIHDWLLLGAALSLGETFVDYHVMRLFAPSSVAREQHHRLSKLYRQLAQTAAPWVPAVIIERLKSYAEFTELIIATNFKRQEFENAVRTAPPALVKSVIILSEHQFAGLDPKRSVIPSSPFIHHPADIPLEDFANGASYILTTYNRLKGIRLGSFHAFGSSYALPDEFEYLIREALKLFALDESEVDVFRAGHICKKRDVNTWVVDPPSEALGRAFALGNIQTLMQSFARRDEIDETQAMRFEDFAKQWFEEIGHSLFAFVESPVRRLLIAFPDVHARVLGEEVLLRDTLFSEERDLLAATCYELVTRLDDLRKFAVTEKLTLWDVLIVSRVFRLLNAGRSYALRKERNHDYQSFLNSSLAIIPSERVRELLVAFGIDEEKAAHYVDLFAWDVRRKDSYADLQYRPFILVEGQVIIPFSLHVGANLFRNVLITKQRRLSSGTQPDLVSAQLCAAIKEKHASAAKGIKFKFQGEESDFDVVFRLGNTLFVFECKNTIKPSSSFEMRATLDQLDKGVLQLDRARRLWRRPEFQRLLQEKVGFDLRGVENVETAIVLSHRLYSGAHYRGHPVRHLRVLTNFIRTGESALFLGAKTHVHRSWSGEHLSETDLRSFLSGDAPSYVPLWRAQQRKDRHLSYGGTVLVKPDYPLDMLALMDGLNVDDGDKTEYLARVREFADKYSE